MLEKLLSLIGKPETYQTPLPEADARHVMGALMVRAAQADDVFLFEEIKIIDQILAKRYDLSPVEAAKMRASCQKLAEAMPDTQEMTSILKDAVSTDEKEATLSALWAVVYADGVKHEQEDALLHQVEDLLGVPQARAKELQLKAKA
jgi:uncharacterized tellurite resistance protein B-like protein